MKLTVTSGTAAAALALSAAFAMPVAAADLGGWGRGSIKDHTPAYLPSPAGPCYFRADVGYSVSEDPTLRWSAWNPPLPYKEKVTGSKMDDTWVGGFGAGCGSGSRGLRTEIMLNYHGQRGLSGVTSPFKLNAADPQGFSSTITSALTTYTGMINGYFDLGNWGGFVPYIGAGVGLAYHQMDEYSIGHPLAGLPAVPWKVPGDNDLTLAWSLMAGAAYQISDRAIVDFGYRYIDLGRANTQRHDNFALGGLSRLSAEDLTAHEFKVGLRYHFGPAGGDCCAPRPVPMK